MRPSWKRTETKNCIRADCPRRQYCRHLCGRHYSLWVKDGRPEISEPDPAPWEYEPPVAAVEELAQRYGGHERN